MFYFGYNFLITLLGLWDLYIKFYSLKFSFPMYSYKKAFACDLKVLLSMILFNRPNDYYDLFTISFI